MLTNKIKDAVSTVVFGTGPPKIKSISKKSEFCEVFHYTSYAVYQDSCHNK